MTKLGTELHTQFIQQITEFDKTLESTTKEKIQGRFGSRSVSEIRSVITQVTKTVTDVEVTDSQLLDRICTACSVDASTQKKLRKICSSSPREGAIALTKALLRTIESGQKGEEYSHELDTDLPSEALGYIETKNKTSDDEFYRNLQSG